MSVGSNGFIGSSEIDEGEVWGNGWSAGPYGAVNREPNRHARWENAEKKKNRETQSKSTS